MLTLPGPGPGPGPGPERERSRDPAAAAAAERVRAYDRDYKREQYRACRRAGICTRCKGARGAAAPGASLCPACQEYDRRRYHTSGAAERSRRLRDERIAAGLCAVCGERPIQPGHARHQPGRPYTKCAECLERFRRYHRHYGRTRDRNRRAGERS